ncbi:MAG: hypothetical protein HN816_00350, partial [Gammaproteobacteria bacterium]|nr:hypothetical protein [Gammaproteobacteria bacterium]
MSPESLLPDPSPFFMRVLELGGGVAAAYTTRLFSEHGAEVIKVEPPGGDPLRNRTPFLQIKDGESTGGLFHALNVNKRSVTLNMAEASDRIELENLIAWADILVHSLSTDEAETLNIDPESVSTRWPALVVLSISPFGISGPYRKFAAQEITTANASGWAALCPITFGEPEHPPLKVYGHHGSMMAATAAAMVGFATCREAKRSGVGEHIDFSIQAYLASLIEAGIPIYSYTGDILRRYHGHRSNPWLFCQTKDNPVLLMCVEEDQWQRLVEFIGEPDWTALEVFNDRKARVENQDLLHILLQDFFAEWRADELFHAAQARRICCAPVLNYDQLSRDPHILDRQLFTCLPDHPELPELMASPILARGGRVRPRLPAPGLGQDSMQVLNTINPRDSVPRQAPILPLAGVRVVDLTWVWAGPYGSMNLAHLGAEVIRIESAKRPDHFRRSPFYPDGVEPGLDSSGMFNQWNQGKSSVAVDLANPAGIELVLKFVASCDVVIENFAA